MAVVELEPLAITHCHRLMLTAGVDEQRPPICATCGVTMVPAALSAQAGHTGDWVCLECEESGEQEAG